MIIENVPHTLPLGKESQAPSFSLSFPRNCHLTRSARTTKAVADGSQLFRFTPQPPAHLPFQSAPVGQDCGHPPLRSGNPQTCFPTSAFRASESSSTMCISKKAVIRTLCVCKTAADSTAGVQKSPLCRQRRQEETRRLPPPN